MISATKKYILVDENGQQIAGPFSSITEANSARDNKLNESSEAKKKEIKVRELLLE